MDEKEEKKKGNVAKGKGKKGENPESEGQGKKSGSKKKLLIIIVAVVAVGAAAAAYFLLPTIPKKEKPIVYAYYSPGEYFVTNVKDSSRLLKTTIVLVLNKEDTKLQDALTLENARIRDTIIFLLRDQGEEDIRTADRKDELRESMIELLNEQLNIDNIVDILFNDFVMQ